MNRHPCKTIIWIDVDCQVNGDLATLADSRGDVAFFMKPRRRTDGRPKLNVRSGTMVFKPNVPAREFVDRWAEISASPHFGDNDQDTLLLSMNVPGVTLEPLNVIWCCTRFDECEELTPKSSMSECDLAVAGRCDPAR